jgi:uncharacterized protein YpiB (UPF0302 family)
MVQVIELVERKVFRFYYIILKQNGYQFSRRISCTLLLYVLQTQNIVHKVPVSFTDQLSSTSLTSMSIIAECKVFCVALLVQLFFKKICFQHSLSNCLGYDTHSIMSPGFKTILLVTLPNTGEEGVQNA